MSQRMRSKILSRDEVVQIVRRAQQQGQKVVTTNGCFDVLHVGHVRYLQAARQLGDLLIVALNSDDSVRRLKGPDRPLMSQDERAEMLAALECVDYVTLFSEDTAIPLLEVVRPDVHVKGGDYKIEQIPERHVVEAYGGKMVIGLNVPGKSTTDLIGRILTVYSKESKDDP